MGPMFCTYLLDKCVLQCKVDVYGDQLSQFEYFILLPLNIISILYMYVLNFVPTDRYDVLGPIQADRVHREETECALDFVGFLVATSPIKLDTKESMKSITESSHRVSD